VNRSRGLIPGAKNRLRVSSLAGFADRHKNAASIAYIRPTCRCPPYTTETSRQRSKGPASPLLAGAGFPVGRGDMARCVHYRRVSERAGPSGHFVLLPGRSTRVIRVNTIPGAAPCLPSAGQFHTVLLTSAMNCSVAWRPSPPPPPPPPVPGRCWVLDATCRPTRQGGGGEADFFFALFSDLRFVPHKAGSTSCIAFPCKKKGRPTD